MKQTDKSKSSLLVTALVMGFVFIFSVVNKKWTHENIVQEPLTINNEVESKEYNELSEYVDSVSIVYETYGNAEDYKISLERLNEEEVEQLHLDVVSTTKGDAAFEEVIRIEANTFGEAFASARYQLGANQEFIWKANGATYTTKFATEESGIQESTPAHYWTDAELNSGTGLNDLEKNETDDSQANKSNQSTAGSLMTIAP
jgi:hypothetical protein|tara:strand:- start:68 stop:673 length:606 start_codon:yes stop_codon:yes gene_type:complete